MSGKRIGVLVTARLGSSRLRRKHLLEVDGVPLIATLLHRIHRALRAEIDQGAAQVVIATTHEPENEAFRHFEDTGTTVFAGSKGNIPLRHLECARALGFDGVVSVDGDDILCAAEAFRAVYDRLARGEAGVKTEGLPFGMNAWGYSTPTLEAALHGHADDPLETGWGVIFADQAFCVRRFDVPGCSDALRFTLDYSEDYAFFHAVISGMGPSVIDASARQLIDHVLANDLTRLNRSRVDEYWENFHRERQRELDASKELS